MDGLLQPVVVWIIAIVLVIFGIAFVGWALFADRSRGRLRCPKCWYDMTGAAGLRCSECGNAAARESKLRRTRRHWRLAALGLLLLVGSPVLPVCRQARLHGWSWFLPVYKVESELKIAGCRVRFLQRRDGEGRAVEIKRGWSKAILFEGGMLYELGSSPWKDDYSGRDHARMVGFGEDITGNGVPDLIVEEYTGGAHCCTIFHICELGDPPRIIREIDAAHGGGVFEDLDHDGIPELTMADWTFAYWRTSFVSSPAPKVILRFDSDDYVVAGDLMRTPAPAQDDLAQQAAGLRATPDWRIGAGNNGFDSPVELWSTMLDLIYTGHADLAWNFFDQAWPPEKPGKTKFLADFVAQLASSPYWSGIEAMNASQPVRQASP